MDNAVMRKAASREGSVSCGLGGGSEPLRRPASEPANTRRHAIPEKMSLWCPIWTAALKGKHLFSAKKCPDITF